MPSKRRNTPTLPRQNLKNLLIDHQAMEHFRSGFDALPDMSAAASKNHLDTESRLLHERVDAKKQDKQPVEEKKLTAKFHPTVVVVNADQHTKILIDEGTMEYEEYRKGGFHHRGETTTATILRLADSDNITFWSVGDYVGFEVTGKGLHKDGPITRITPAGQIHTAQHKYNTSRKGHRISQYAMTGRPGAYLIKNP